MISLDDALAAYPAHLQRLPDETIDVTASLHRVLAEPVYSLTDLPRWDQSAMDGYALRASDLLAASVETPLRLPVSVTIAAGSDECLPALQPGTAARIFTGAPLPPGADTMIPQERISREGNALVFSAPWPARKNIRWRGEEMRTGAPVAAAGQRVTPGLLSALVNAGLQQLRVVRQPRIALLTTGDEVRPVGSELKPGQIPDSNGPLMHSMLKLWGYNPLPAVHVADDITAVHTALGQAFAEADLVLSCGGASVGDRDFLPAVAEAHGMWRVLKGVAQKPGKPLFFGVGEHGAMMALPGNPGAVLIGLCLHVRRALDCLEGLAHPGPIWQPGRLAESIERDHKRVRLLRMRLQYSPEGTALLDPLPNQDSHMLGNLAAADVLVRVPEGTDDCAAGTTLHWTPLPG